MYFDCPGRVDPLRSAAQSRRRQREGDEELAAQARVVAFDNRGNQIYLNRMHILLHSRIAFDNVL